MVPFLQEVSVRTHSEVFALFWSDQTSHAIISPAEDIFHKIIFFSDTLDFQNRLAGS